MESNDSLRDILHTLLRIETRLDGHDQRFEAIDQRFDSVDQRFADQKEQINALTEFTIKGLNSIDGEVQALSARVGNVEQRLKNVDQRTLKLEMSFEDFRSDARAYWEQLTDNKEAITDHEVRITSLERAGGAL